MKHVDLKKARFITMAYHKLLFQTITLMTTVLTTTSFSAYAENSRIEEPTIGLSYLYSEEMENANIVPYVTEISPIHEVGEIDFYHETTFLGAILVMKNEIYENGYGSSNALDYYQAYYTDYDFSEEVNDDYHYLIIDPSKTIDESSVTPACLELYSELLASIEYIPLVPAKISSKLTFQTMNLEGALVSDDILGEKDITIINVWATFCNPCINEMPDLAQWETELPENVQLLYLCSDINTEDSSNIELADMIAEKSGINKKNVLYQLNGSFEELNPFVTAVPTTFFVDREGYVLDDIIVGANVEKYKETLEILLK